MRFEPPPSPVSTTRLADPGRGPAIVASLVVAFVAAAVGSSILTGAPPAPPANPGEVAQQTVEPKASLAAQAPGSGRQSESLPSPTAEPSLRPGEIACMPAGWRLAYVGSVMSLPVETYLVVEPSEASSPLDARIPVTWLGRDVIAGLGACAPPDGAHGGARPAVVERAWRVARAGGSDVVVPIELVAFGRPELATPGSRPDAVALVRPAGPDPSWAPGEYVLELALRAAVGQAPSAGPSAWLRIHLEPPTP